MSIELSAEAKQKIEELKKEYPDPKSAVMPALYIAQGEHQVLSPEVIAAVADVMEMPPVHVEEVAKFYTMYYKKPVGKYHFQVCRTLSCALGGSKKLMEALHDRFGVNPGEVTADGKYSYEPVECLGACGMSPVCEVNDTYFENLSPEKLLEIIDRIETENPDLRFSTEKDKLGVGFADRPKSEMCWHIKQNR